MFLWGPISLGRGNPKQEREGEAMSAMPSIRAEQVQVNCGWYWSWKWRYFVGKRRTTKAGLIRSYAETLGYARLCGLIEETEQAAVAKIQADRKRKEAEECHI